MDKLSPRSIARASCGDAHKLRSNLQSQVTQLRKERGNAIYTSLFEALEQTLAQLRLACMQAIFHDVEYAADKKVEHTLWQAHTSINGEYRKIVNKLGGQSQVVQKRKVERMYKDFLKTSQSFYCGYIQRLAGRFYIPELRQAAQNLDMQPAEMPSREASPPSSVRKLVTDSCQISLVRLGDLARYRCQMSDRSMKASFNTALAYYGLANSVDPDNGSAHHQMAVLYQLHSQHFEIVYHFHRAIAVAKPHELGLGNLEREYRGLQSPVATQVNDSADAMISWFIRLHGFYSQGESFSQQSELETEVLHRLARALKADNNEKTLLRMALINIAAYDIATNRVKDAWTLNASRTCQFLLRWAVRNIALVFDLVKTELQSEDVATTLQDCKIDTAESPITFSPILTKLLPFFRIYVAWIYTVRADIVEYRDFLEPHIRELYRSLADSLTLLNTYIEQSNGAAHSKYLLTEDVETIGLRPLSDRKLPLFLVAEELTDVQPPKKCKVRKSRKEALRISHSTDTENIWRIRDIVYSGILLAGSARFPVSIITVKCPNGQELAGWVFTEEHSAESYIDGAGITRMLEHLDVSNSTGISDGQMRPLNATAEGAPQQSIPEMKAPTVVTPKIASGKSLVAPKVQRESRPAAKDVDISQDDEMQDMVNKLLDPSDEGTSKQPQSFGDSTYGMNSSTADEIFGQLRQGSGGPSPISKTIPSLPWDYFYTPSGNNATGAPDPAAACNGQNIPRTPVGGYAASGETLTISQNAAAHRNSFVNHDSRQSNDSSRAAVLQSLAQSLYAEHVHGQSPSSLGPTPGMSLARPGSGFTSPIHLSPGHGASPNSTNKKVSVSWSRHGSDEMQQGLGIPGQSFSRRGSRVPSFGADYTAGPSIWNDAAPVRGGSNIGFDGQMGQLSGGARQGSPSHTRLGSIDQRTQKTSPWAPRGSDAGHGSLSFSHPSSLMTGTPKAFSAARAEVHGAPDQGSSPLRQAVPGGIYREEQVTFPTAPFTSASGGRGNGT